MTEGTRWQFALFVAGMVVLHFVLRVGLGLGVLAPNLILVALLLAARRLRPGSAAGLGLLLGLLEGSANPELFGFASLAMVFVGFLGSRSRDWLAGDDPLNLVAYLFGGTFLYELTLYLMLAFTGINVSPMALVLPTVLAALYAAAAGLAASMAYRTVAA